MEREAFFVMKRSAIPNSNSLILSMPEWIFVGFLFVAIITLLSLRWHRWEKFNPDSDYRLPCWEEKKSDYWAFSRWCKYARSRYKVFVIGGSVIWGQEVKNDETMSHYLNQFAGNEELFANMALDGLHPVAMYSLAKYYGRYLNNKHILLLCSPFWMSSKNFDLQGDWYDFHHPRLAPQFWPRIKCYKEKTDVRLGVLLERNIPFIGLIRHILSNYYENMNVQKWMAKYPYRNPLACITFKSAAVLAEVQGTGTSWQQKECYRENLDVYKLSASESLQWEYFKKTIKLMQSRNNKLFVLLLYHPYLLSPESRKRLARFCEGIGDWLDEEKISYFDVETDIPSRYYADECSHLLKEGHIRIAKLLLQDKGFQEWLKEDKKRHFNH